MKKIIATPSRTKEILETYQLFAKKNYGQNFLVEPGIVEKIARLAVISDHCAVFEIGPGIGALTQFLAEYAKEVTAFEIDDRLIPVLADTLEEQKNVTVIHGDFLEQDLSSLMKAKQDQGLDVVVAANLPYYITTPILFKLFESPIAFQAITVMMQKEVADRFAAQPNTKEYNALSVLTQYRCQVKQLMKIPMEVFQPRPAVDSAVVQFICKPQRELGAGAEPQFYEMVKACFKQRRKTILNNYGEYCGDKQLAREILADAEIDAGKRGEALSLERFLKLFAAQQAKGLFL